MQTGRPSICSADGSRTLKEGTGLPSIAVVGLPDNAVKESTARVKSAIVNSGYPFPARRITVNLAPAALNKGLIA